MGQRHTTADTSAPWKGGCGKAACFSGLRLDVARWLSAPGMGAAGVKPLGGLVGLPPAKASTPVWRRGTSR